MADKKKDLTVNTAFLNYSNEDTDVVEIDFDEPLHHIFLKNKQIRMRVLSIVVIALFVFVL